MRIQGCEPVPMVDDYVASEPFGIGSRFNDTRMGSPDWIVVREHQSRHLHVALTGAKLGATASRNQM